MKVGEMQLQVNLVAQDILAQWAANHWLHGMLGHHVELHTVGIFTAVVAIWTLLNLRKIKQYNKYLIESREKHILCNVKNPKKTQEQELLFAQDVLLSGYHSYTTEPLV